MSTISRAALCLGVACSLALAAMAAKAGPEQAALSGASCQLNSFTGQAQRNGWLVQELTFEERLNFLDHINHDSGRYSNFYPPHLWETVRKKDDRIHIRVVFLDERNCVLGNSGEIAFDEFSYLLAPNIGY